MPLGILIIPLVLFSTFIMDTDGAYTESTIMTSNFRHVNSQTNGDASIYENSTYGIRFHYPNNWTKTEVLSQDNILIEFSSPLANPSDRYKESINIFIDKILPENISTLSEYISEVDTVLNRTFGYVDVLYRIPSVVSGLPAIERAFSMEQPGSNIDISVAQIFAIKDNRIYIITYTAEDKAYHEYSPMIESLINSFQIIN